MKRSLLILSLLCTVTRMTEGMQQLVMVPSVVQIDILLEGSLEDFIPTLHQLYQEHRVSELSLSSFLKELFQRLYESEDPEFQDKCKETVAFFTQRLPDIPITDLLELYLYLDGQKSNSISLGGFFEGYPELGSFYELLKEIWSSKILEDMTVLQSPGIALSPRALGINPTLSPRKQQRSASSTSLSPRRPRKQPPQKPRRLVSPRKNQAEVDGTSHELPASPAVMRRRPTDPNIVRTALPSRRSSLSLNSTETPTTRSWGKATSTQFMKSRRRTTINTPMTPAKGSPEMPRKARSGTTIGSSRHVLPRSQKKDGSLKKESQLVRDIQDAVRKGDVHKLKHLVEQLKDENKLDEILPMGYTLLIWAIEHESIVLVIMLFQEGASPDQQDARGRTPLMVAILKGTEDFWTICLRYATDVLLQDQSGRTALHYAARNGHHDLLTPLLLKGKELLDMQDEKGYTPVMLAIIFDYPEAALTLIQMGAAVVQLKDLYGNTVLHHLAASATCAIPDICNVLPEFTQEEINAANIEGYTPLMSALLKRNSVIEHWLLERGADATLVDDRGDTMMHICAQENYVESPILQMVQLIDRQNKKGETPLMHATEHDNRTACEKLLSLDADLSLANSEGDTAFHIAVQYGNMYMVNLFCDRIQTDIRNPGDKQVDYLNLRNKKGYTPLMCAVDAGYDHIIKKLLLMGAEVNCLSLEGQSAFSIADRKGLASVGELSRYVCGVCQDIHTVSEHSFLCDVRRGDEANVRAHLANGISADTHDTSETPGVVLAARAGMMKIVSLLLQAGADRGVLMPLLAEMPELEEVLKN